jgi:DNA-binding transcriptional MerR regulator
MAQLQFESLRIGSVSRRTGLSIDAIRFYERRHLLKPPIRSGGGFRLFREEDVETLFFIERAQEMGFSLDEIRELVALRSDAKACSSVQRLLGTKLAVVRRKLADLRALEADLASALRECNAALSKRRGVGATACPVLGEIATKHASKTT